MSSSPAARCSRSRSGRLWHGRFLVNGIRIDQDVETTVPSQALFALVDDLPRYVKIEPYLLSAYWLTSAPVGAGSVAEVVVAIPFTMAVVRRAIGALHGRVTVTGWKPPTELAGEFEHRTVAVRVTIQVTERQGVQIACVRGVINPRSRAARVLLQPVRPVLEMLVARSIERGLRRVEAALK
jgi:hypothetical protein